MLARRRHMSMRCSSTRCALFRFLLASCCSSTRSRRLLSNESSVQNSRSRARTFSFKMFILVQANIFATHYSHYYQTFYFFLQRRISSPMSKRSVSFLSSLRMHRKMREWGESARFSFDRIQTRSERIRIRIESLALFIKFIILIFLVSKISNLLRYKPLRAFTLSEIESQKPDVPVKI